METVVRFSVFLGILFWYFISDGHFEHVPV
jgi:hypothetical protein